MEANKQKESDGSAVAVAQKAQPAKKRKPAQMPRFHVILLNDDDHTYEYVIEMLKVIFAYSDERGFELAKEVDREGRVILLTTHRELAELKRDQIHAYGVDPRVATCKGSMSATIEAAEE
jgi:ATP-dependent Clp protease adaptor protein ClpS